MLLKYFFISLLVSLTYNASLYSEQSLKDQPLIEPAHQLANNYIWETPQQAEQFHQLLKNFRCLVCQNQDLADSNSDLAQDLKKQIYHLLKTGKTPKDIESYLSARYGDFILFKPPFKISTLRLWIGPWLFIICGLIIFLRIYGKLDHL